MKTQNKKIKQNQLRFIEYEKPTKDGHFITVGDSYHNLIGRVHKIYNEESKKYEYAAFGHDGSLMTRGDKLWEVKNVFINNREQLLEQAHQRRIAVKQPTKSEERKAEMEKLREDKTDVGKASKAVDEELANDELDQDFDNAGYQENLGEEDERKQELNDIRNNNDDDRGDVDMER